MASNKLLPAPSMHNLSAKQRQHRREAVGILDSGILSLFVEATEDPVEYDLEEVEWTLG